jgi:hypothetical protein
MAEIQDKGQGGKTIKTPADPRWCRAKKGRRARVPCVLQVFSAPALPRQCLRLFLPAARCRRVSWDSQGVILSPPPRLAACSGSALSIFPLRRAKQRRRAAAAGGRAASSRERKGEGKGRRRGAVAGCA